MNKEKPNVLWIFTDQHRGQAMSCAGDPNVETPNLDRLANEGVHFTNAYSSTPVCTPFRACLYTGQYITTHGTLSNHYPLLPKYPILPEIMQENGYHTSHMGKWHLSGGCFGHHFVSQYFRPGWDDWLGWECQHLNNYFDTEYSVNTSPAILHTNKYQTDWLADRTIEWIEKQPQDRPWFHVVSIEPPHPPCIAPDEYMEAYKDRELQFHPNFQMDHPRRDQHEKILRGYYAQIKNIDDNIGRMIDTLEKSGQLDNTIILYFADHGDMMGSHGMMGKCKPEEESSKIPLIIRYPKLISKGRKTNALISAVDIMPTLLGLLDIPTPSNVDGDDLSSTACGQDDCGAGIVYLQYEGFGFPERPEHIWRAVRSGDWLYTYTFLDGPTQLFNLESDPYQINNLINSSEYKPIRKELREKMQEKADKIGDNFFQRSNPKEGDLSD